MSEAAVTNDEFSREGDHVIGVVDDQRAQTCRVSQEDWDALPARQAAGG